MQEFLCRMTRRLSTILIAYYYNVTLSQTIQPLQRALTMGQRGGVVLFLPISDALQRLVGREWLLGEHGGDKQQGLPEGQRPRPLCPRLRVRTRP